MPTSHDNRSGKRTTLHPIVFSLITGLFAGFFWGLVRWLAVGFRFTQVPQAFLVDPFVRRSVLIGFWWQLLGLALFMVMSAAAAVVYWFVLGRLRGPWPGIFFGAAWWAVLFYVVGPDVGAVLNPRILGWQTLITELCLYVVWGLFIGYSIAFEFHDEARREPTSKGSSGGREPQTAS